MKSIGGALLFFGIGSIVLHFLEREFTLLSWIDNWGDTPAWAIRGGMIIVGAILLFMSRNGSSE